MSNEDAEKQQNLDEQYPFVEPGADTPKDGRERGWRTRNGNAVVAWNRDGTLIEVISALLPDGTRGDVSGTLDYGLRRRSSGPKHWIYGTVDVRDDDVVFTDRAEQPTYTPPPLTDTLDLEAELARDDAFLVSLQDDRLAKAMYAVFRNRDFLKVDIERRWSCGDRQAARLVSDLRDLGESYHDYYLDEFPGTWPDDRAAREASLRQAIEHKSKQTRQPTFDDLLAEFERVRTQMPTIALPPGVTDEQMQEEIERLREKILANREKSEAFVAEKEAHRIKTLELARRDLAELERAENADAFNELRGHLTRLGWRTETASDRAIVARRAHDARLTILREIKRLELRPEGVLPDWAPPELRGGAITTATLVAVPHDASVEDREAYHIGPRLKRLAQSGRITKQEYDLLRARIAGPER